MSLREQALLSTAATPTNSRQIRFIRRKENNSLLAKLAGNFRYHHLEKILHVEN